VIAASVDSIDDAQKIAAELHLPFPIAYGLDPVATTETLGGFYKADPADPYLQPTDIIVGPDGRVLSSTYSSGPVGRMRADEALDLIASKRAQS